MELLLLLLFFHSLIYGPYLLPIRHAWFVESHEVDLTRWSTFGTAEEYFVIAFAQKLQTLRFFMHEDTIQVTRFNRAYLCKLKKSEWATEIPKMQTFNFTSIALLPQPIICPVPMYATDVGISPHCK